MKPFEGQVALVTGSSKGIGAATAEALAREGAHVILTGRDTKALEAIEQRACRQHRHGRELVRSAGRPIA